MAGTANLDYFSGNTNLQQEGAGHFAGVAFPPRFPNRYIPIPGANVSFYVPFEAYGLLTWSITWVNDSNANQLDSQTANLVSVTDIALFIDDDYAASLGTLLEQTAFTRQIGTTVLGESSNGTERDLQDRYKSRTWSGHCFLDGHTLGTLKPGFHTAGLRICQHNAVKQSRVRARSMKYMYFKYGDS